MPFSFLHPAFLNRRGLLVPAPTRFIYVDRQRQRALEHHDDQAVITSTRLGAGRLGPFEGVEMLVAFESLTQPEAFPAREVALLYLRAENADVRAWMATTGWAPDFLMAVCDGCAFGGNKLCENIMTAERVQDLPLPKYWVTEHLGGVQPGSWREGDLIEPLDPKCSIRLRKLALLSSEWGHYGPWMGLRGATLFEVTRTS